MKKCNPEKTKIIIKALQLALRRLEAGDSYYVCNAITDSATEAYPAYVAKAYVNSVIDDQMTVISWIKFQSVSLHAEIDGMLKSDRLRLSKLSLNYRIRWVKHMIKELSEFLYQDWGIVLTD